MQTYFTEVWVNRDETSLDSEIFSDLPSYLRAKVAQYVTTDLVLQVCKHASALRKACCSVYSACTRGWILKLM